MWHEIWEDRVIFTPQMSVQVQWTGLHLAHWAFGFDFGFGRKLCLEQRITFEMVKYSWESFDWWCLMHLFCAFPTRHLLTVPNSWDAAPYFAHPLEYKHPRFVLAETLGISNSKVTNSTKCATILIVLEDSRIELKAVGISYFGMGMNYLCCESPEGDIDCICFSHYQSHARNLSIK